MAKTGQVGRTPAGMTPTRQGTATIHSPHSGLVALGRDGPMWMVSYGDTVERFVTRGAALSRVRSLAGGPVIERRARRAS